MSAEIIFCASRGNRVLLGQRYRHQNLFRVEFSVVVLVDVSRWCAGRDTIIGRHVFTAPLPTRSRVITWPDDVTRSSLRRSNTSSVRGGQWPVSVVVVGGGNPFCRQFVGQRQYPIEVDSRRTDVSTTSDIARALRLLHSRHRRHIGLHDVEHLVAVHGSAGVAEPSRRNLRRADSSLARVPVWLVPRVRHVVARSRPGVGHTRMSDASTVMPRVVDVRSSATFVDSPSRFRGKTDSAPAMQWVQSLFTILSNN